MKLFSSKYILEAQLINEVYFILKLLVKSKLLVNIYQAIKIKFYQFLINHVNNKSTN